MIFVASWPVGAAHFDPRSLSSAFWLAASLGPLWALPFSLAASIATGFGRLLVDTCFSVDWWLALCVKTVRTQEGDLIQARI